MDIPSAIYGILIPATLAGIILLLARAPWRPRGKRARAAGWALAAASVAGYIGTRGLPPLPFGERTLASQQWRVFATIFVALAAGGLLKLRSEPLRWAGLFVVFAVALRGVLDAQFRNYWDFNTGWAWIGGFALVTTVQAGCFSFQARRPGVGRPILLWVYVSAIAVVLLLGKSGSAGQLVGSLAAALGAAGVLALLRRDDAPLDGVGAVLGFLCASFLLEGYYFAYVPLYASIVMASVPLILTLGELPPLARGKGTVLTPLQWLLVIVPCAVALWMTWSGNAQPESQYPY